MNEDTLKGNWTQLKGKIREQWGKLTDDDLDVINGKREQLIGALRTKYGHTQDEAERALRSFEDRLATPTSTTGEHRR
jgi:uncharacterized protein YjbJ (UPF0337 family)